MKTQEYQEALQDVANHFATPEAIVAANDLTEDQKIALLRQWEQDARLLMVATEENMTADVPDHSGEQLQKIHRALAKLGFEPDPEKESAHKSGAAPLRRQQTTKH